jgi:hypothetical protein
MARLPADPDGALAEALDQLLGQTTAVLADSREATVR